MPDKEVAIRDEQQLMVTPAEVVEIAKQQSKLLMDIVEQTKCYQNIQGKKYLQVEAWETIGAFNRTHAETEIITPIEREGQIVGYQARVQLWKEGTVVGGAVMPCYFTENACKGKYGDAKHKACMSAAQTFATSKAYRMNFSYVAILAGFQPTPAEEIIEGEFTPELLTQPQLKKLHALAKEKGYNPDVVKHHIKVKYFVDSSKELTKQQAGELIDLMQNEGKLEPMDTEPLFGEDAQ